MALIRSSQKDREGENGAVDRKWGHGNRDSRKNTNVPNFIN